MKLLLITLALTVPLSLVSVAHADHTLQEFQDARAAGGAKWQAFQLYVEGLGDGFEMALRRPLVGTGVVTTYASGNVVSATVAADPSPRQTPPYCPNAKQPLDLGIYLSAIDKQIETSKPMGNEWLGGVLMSGLIKVFPCDKRKGLLN